MQKLKPKQIRFVEEYLIDFNATQAAIRAGYSKKTARNIAGNLLTKINIQKEISGRLKAYSEKSEITRERVLLEIARLAFNDPRKAFDSNGNLLPVHNWSTETAAAISSIEVNELIDTQGNVIGHTKKIKFWDKGKQLELASRCLGMLTDKVLHEGEVSIDLYKNLSPEELKKILDKKGLNLSKIIDE
jgi:phage terminase small subunit